MNRGFSLLEVIIVVFLISIVATFVFTSFIEYSNNQKFIANETEIKSLLKEARQKTLAAETTTQFGVRVGTSSLVVFEGLSYTLTNPTNRIYSFPDVALSSTFSNSSSSFYYARLTGEASATGTIFLYDRKLNATTSIIIMKAGLIQ